MYEFNTTITDEGAILLTRIIEWHEYATFKKLWFSENNYVGQEATLTADTFGGVFATENVSASIIDNTTIKISAAIFSPAQDDTLYSIGVIMDDNGTNVLVAVCTTSDPMPISQGAGNRFAFNINLTVSSTSDITVVGTTAAVLYDTDIVDNLTTADATKVLSANMGHTIADNLAANENVYGAKNLLKYPFSDTTKTESGVAFTDNGDGTITLNNTATADVWFNIHNNFGLYLENGSYKMNGTPVGAGSSCYWYIHYKDTNNNDVFVNDTGDGNEFTIQGSYGDANGANVSVYLVALNGKSFSNVVIKPMIRDARILDDTFVPHAKTNLQLTRELYGESGTFTLTPISGTYTDGFASQENHCLRVGGLLLVYGVLVFAGNPDSSHAYVTCSGLPFSSNSRGEVGFIRISNNGKVASGVRHGGTNTITLYFDLADGTYPTTGQQCEYTLMIHIY